MALWLPAVCFILDIRELMHNMYYIICNTFLITIKKQFLKICWKCTHPQVIKDVDAFVSSLKQLWENLALHHLNPLQLNRGSRGLMD